MIYYLNGNFIENNYNTLDINDRGFLLGDGVFTTIKAISGRLILFDKHLNRLNSHAKLIKINIHLDLEAIEDICQRLLLKNNLLTCDAVFRITLTRGIGERGISIPESHNRPTLLISVVPHKKVNLSSISLTTTSFIRYEKSLTSQIKSLNYLESVLARDEAINNGFNDAIFLNSIGNIVCTTVANIFFIHNNGDVITPPLSDGALSGIMRNSIIDRQHLYKFKVIEKSIKISNLDDYIGCFITNSIIGVQTVNRIGNKIFSMTDKDVQTGFNIFF